MRKVEKKTLVLAAVMLVVTALLTWLARADIAVDGTFAGYWTMGDVAVYVSAALLGGPWGALCAGLGSALADILAGAAIYAPASLVIKAGMAFLCAWLLRRGNRNDWLYLARLIGACGGVMTLGYFLYDLVLRGNYMIAALGLPFNLLQVMASAIVAIPVLKLMQGKPYDQADPFASAQSTRRRLK